MIAKMNVGVLFATVGNSIPAVFWTLLHLIDDPKAMSACIDAVLKVAERREMWRDWFTLEELNELSILQSAFWESLRMYQTAFVT